MPAPFEYLRDPAPLSLPSMLVGDTVFLLLGGLTLFALFALPLLRGFGVTVGAVRWLARAAQIAVARPRVVADPERPLSTHGLSPALAGLAEQTRILALELRRRSEEARHWPDDAGELASVRVRWLSSLVGEPVGVGPVLDTRRDVFEWLDSVARLPEADRARLVEAGVDVEAVRAALTAERAIVEEVRALAGLLWAIDERLAGLGEHGYRSAQTHAPVPSRAGFGLAGLGRSPLDRDRDGGDREGAGAERDELARRRRYAELIAAEGSGLARLAGRYAKTAAEREDLEQDILLALWQALPRFRGEASLTTFAYRVGRYCCYRHVRRRAKHADHRASEADVELLAELGPFDALDGGALGAEASLLRADELATLDQARASLPASLAAPLSLHLSGLSYAQIAARLGITERNVSVRLTRARAKLRDRFALA